MAEISVITWVHSGTGIVFVVLGRRMLDGRPGVFPERHEPYSQVFIVLEGVKLFFYYLKALNTREYEREPARLADLTRDTNCPDLGLNND